LIANVQNVTDKLFLNKLGKRIKFLRESQKMTQLDLGIMCQNHAEQIGRVERGQHNVTVCSLLKISLALNVTLKDIFDFDYTL